jgi:hypothetical protein
VSGRRPGTQGVQLPLLDAAEVDPASTSTCQRWSYGTHSWRRRREGGFDRRLYAAHRVDKSLAKAFVKRHHYLHTFVAERLSWGLYQGEQLVGVAVFGPPSHEAVLTNVFPDEEPYKRTLVLSRFVLLDEVPANGETWFLGQVFAAAACEGLRGVVSFADPVMRRAVDGTVVVPGHRGTIYAAKGAQAIGRSDPSIVLVLPDGTTLDRRARSKVRRDESGHEYVQRRLAGFGVAPRRPRESGEAYLARALVEAGVVELRHGGCYRYAFQLGETKAERAAVRIALPAGPYPKAIDESSWEKATRLTAPTIAACDPPKLL